MYARVHFAWAREYSPILKDRQIRVYDCFNTRDGYLFWVPVNCSFALAKYKVSYMKQNASLLWKIHFHCVSLFYNRVVCTVLQENRKKQRFCSFFILFNLFFIYLFIYLFISK